MLRSLRIQNMAVVDQLQLDFEPGMNVLTGETGAGKSIITRAIGLLCGDRAQSDLVRTEAEEATVEGLFDVVDPMWLTECGLDAAPELLIRRVISRGGKSRVYLNGSPSTAAVLSQVGTRLLHVYGQHEQTLLLKSENHLELLDAFGALGQPRSEMAATHAAFREARERLRRLESDREVARQKTDLLRFQIGELREANVVAGEEENLRHERERQRHAEKLARIYQQSEETLYSGEDAVSGAVAKIIALLEDAGRIDPDTRAPLDVLRQARAQIEDVALTLRRAAGHIEHDAERLAEIEDRLALMGRLQRKYGCLVDELPERLESMEAELLGLERTSENLSALAQEVDSLELAAREVARTLSQLRRAAASRLEAAMDDELRALGMPEGTFRVVFTAPVDGDTEEVSAPLTAFGCDTVEFHLSANPGEDPRPLARIASGGELSRIMLALKTLTAAGGEARTLIFDEVDAGIGGLVAEAVGRRLHALARSRQVLCITHLPQIAALADHQYAVEKRVQAGRTYTSARSLRGDDRIHELARMLGGTDAESRRYARRLMSSVDPGGTR